MNKNSILKELYKVVIPMAVQNLLVTIVNASDAIMLGALDVHSLSAANLAGQLMQIYNFFLVSLCVGTTVLAAQFWGQKDITSIKKVLHITLQISLTSGLLFFLICIFTPQMVMSFFTSDPTLISLGSDYLRYVSGAYLFMGYSQIYMIIMKNTGRVNQSSIYGGITVVVNIVFNTILIFGLFGLPEMGIKGAALATTIARFIEFTLTVYASKNQKKVGFSIHELFTKHSFLETQYIRYTLPSIVQTMSWRIATTVNIAILGHMSNTVIAANAIANIVSDIMSSVAMAYASGCGIMIGPILGNGEFDDAKKYGDVMLKHSRVLGLALGIVTCLVTPFVLFVSMSLPVESKDYLMIMLFIIAFKMIGKLNNASLSKGIFVAGGDIRYHMKVDIINMWCVIVPLSLLATYVFKLPVIFIYLIMNLDEYTKIYFENSRYKKYIWVKNITKEGWAE